MSVGTVLQVLEHVDGSELVAAPSGSTIQIVDPEQYNADGGYVTLTDDSGNSETIGYVFDATSADVLDLDSAPTGTYVTGNMIYMTDASGNRVITREADVQEPQGEETLRCRVPHSLFALLPEGLRTPDNQEQVVIANDGTDMVITDVLGKAPGFDGVFLDTQTVLGDAIASEQITGRHIIADDLLANKISAVLLISATLKTSESYPAVWVNSDGIKWFDSSGGIGINFPTDGSAVSIAASILANQIVVNGQASLRGSSNEMIPGAAMTLASTLSSPTLPPTCAIDYAQLPLISSPNLAGAVGTGVFYTATGGSLGGTPSYYISQDVFVAGLLYTSYLEEYNASTGVFMRTLANPVGARGAVLVTVAGSRKIIVLGNTLSGSGADWFLQRYDATTLNFEQSVNLGLPNTGNSSSAFLGLTTIAGTPTPTVVTFKSSNPTAASVARLIGFDSATLAPTSTTDLSGRSYTPSAGEDRFVALTEDGSGNLWVGVRGDPTYGNINQRYTSGAYVANHDFSSAGVVGSRGVTWNSTDSLFHSRSAGTPRLYTHTNWDWTTENPKYWFGYSWYNSTAPGTFTVTIATPAVFTRASHGLVAGDQVFFTTTGALPTGLTAGTTYYVIAAGLTANDFEVSTTPGGSAVATTGSQSGVHTLNVIDETLVSPLTSLDMTNYRRARALVTMPTFPSSVSKARLYVVRNATSPSTTALLLQVAPTYVDFDTVAAQHMFNYNTSAAAPQTVNSFGTGTPAELKAAPTAGGVTTPSIQGDGTFRPPKATTTNLGTFTPGGGEGSLGYDTTLHLPVFWNGSAWVAVDERGVELGYSEITANATAASTTPADVAGLSVTVTVASRPIKVIFDCGSSNNGAANGGVRVDILEDATAIGRASSLVNSASAAVPLHRELRRAPAAGSHTYKIQLATLFSNTATLSADNYTAVGPAFIQVLEV